MSVSESESRVRNSFLEKISAFSALLTTLIAAGALYYADQQITAATQASARDAYKEYLKAAIEQPDIADGDFSSSDRNASDKAKYQWFVSYFLFSAEQVYAAFHEDDGWRMAISDQVCYHKIYLGSKIFQSEVKRHYSIELQKLIDRALKENCV